MIPKLYLRLQGHLRRGEVELALKLADQLLVAHPLAAQLHTYRGRLLQLSEKACSMYDDPLGEVEKALSLAQKLDRANLDILIELMHLYDIVLPNRSRALQYARKVRSAAKKAWTEANAIIEDRES